MLGNFLTLLSGGQIARTIGNGNITIQGTENSTININSIDDIKEVINTHLSRDNKSLYLVVFGNFQNTLPTDWKPFEHETFIELVKLSTANLKNVNVILWFIHYTNTLTEDEESILKAVIKETILVVDTKTNLELSHYQWFNQFLVGGCIAVPSKDENNYGSFMRTLVRTRYEDNQMLRNKKTFKYAFKNVHSDFDIMEHIGNITTAYMHLEIDEQILVKKNNFDREAINNILNS